MRPLRDASIRKKLVLLLATVSSLAALVSCTTLLINDVRMIRSSSVSHLSTLADVLGANGAASLLFKDPVDGHEVLSSLRLEPAVASGRIYDQAGNPFASYYKETGPNQAAAPPTAPKGHVTFTRDGSLELSKPIRYDNETIGTIHLRTNDDQVGAQLRGYTAVAAATVLFAMLVSLLLSSVLQRLISTPILKLVNTTQLVGAKGDYSVRAEKTTNDELGSLCDAFNEMLEKIRQRDSELEAHRLHLEDVVTERTAALKSRTVELQEVNGSLEYAIERATEMAAKAREASQAKSEFLANMSHELRTPLHGILSFADFGIKKHTQVKPDKLLTYFQHIRKSGDTLLRLLNDLLDLAKLESKKMTFEFQSADLSALVASVLDEFSSLVSERGLRIQDETGNFHEKVALDSTRIQQVLRNLLSNAVKFSLEGTTIEAGISGKEDSVVVWVRDRGPGVPEEELERVFEKFVQSSKTKSGAGGTGLGLAICREIITAHHGRIWAENCPDGGGVFSFEIPRSLETTKGASTLSRDGAISEA